MKREVADVLWLAKAEYADGTEFEKTFPYHAGGSYVMEQKEQYEIECWLLQRETPSPVVWYSVQIVEEI